MKENGLDETLQAALAGRARSGLARQRRVVTVLPNRRVEIEGRLLIDFASNDYLDLRSHPALLDAAAGVTSAGSGASGLVSGHTPLHAEAERALAAWKGTEDAVLLPSGYQANFAVVQALAGAARAADRPVRFLLDKLCHASLIDAVRATNEPLRVFPHNQAGKLRRLLREGTAGTLEVVCTESVFSMDGDCADLVELAAVKAEHPFVLLLDEAHGTGLYGPTGAGLASALGLTAAIDVYVVTLSKALGGAGGAVCGTTALAAAVMNFARAYIYSTSVAPGVAAVAAAAIKLIQKEPRRRERVLELSRDLRAKLKATGIAVVPGDSPIVPVVIGDEVETMTRAASLRTAGFLVGAVRPPTVPRGSSRLRVTLSSGHTESDVAALAAALARPPAF